jgi:hypothetical protein
MYIIKKNYLQWIYWTLFFIARCSTIFLSELPEHSCVENVRFMMGMGDLVKQVSLDWMWLRHFHTLWVSFISFECLLNVLVECATLNMIFCVTYYLELHNAISIYCTSHILPTNVKLVVWLLHNIDNFTWSKFISVVKT